MSVNPLPGPLSLDAYPRAASWLSAIRAFCQSSELKSGVGYRVNRSTGGTTLDIIQRSGGNGDQVTVNATGPSGFQIVQTVTAADPTPADNKVRVLAGTVYWHSKDILVDLGGGWASTEITVTSNLKFWVMINNPFTTSTPTFTVNSGAAFPAEPLEPSRKYWRIGEVTFTAGTPPVIAINQLHVGGIPWPTVFGYWA